MDRFSQGQLWNIFFHWTTNTKKSKKFTRVHRTVLSLVLYQFALKIFQNMNIYLFYVQKITNMLSSLLIQIMKWFTRKFEVVIWTVFFFAGISSPFFMTYLPNFRSDHTAYFYQCRTSFIMRHLAFVTQRTDLMLGGGCTI